MPISTRPSTPRQQLTASTSAVPRRSPKPGQEQPPTALYPQLSLFLSTPPRIPSGLKQFDKMSKKSKIGLADLLKTFLNNRKGPRQQLEVAAAIRPTSDDEDDTSNDKAIFSGHDASELEKLYSLMIEDFICNALEGPGKQCQPGTLVTWKLKLRHRIKVAKGMKLTRSRT